MISDAGEREVRLGVALGWWMRTAVRAVGWSAILFFLVVFSLVAFPSAASGLSLEGIVGGAAWALFFTVVSTVVHGVAFAVTGIPLMLLIVVKRWSAVNHLPSALALGAGMGALVVILGSGGRDIWPALVVPSVYGLVTGYAAWRCRPQILGFNELANEGR